MELISSLSDKNKLKENKLIAGKDVNLNNTVIKFNGKNNILFIGDNVNISGSTINFNADNSICYLSESNKVYRLNISLNNNNVIYFGKNNYINNTLNAITSEEQNIIIGNNCLLSFGIFIRTADPHLIYDCKAKKRINKSKSVFVGDHVWIGQNTLILKGTKIGSGSIIGGASVCSNKIIESNTSSAGNPIKTIKRGVYFSSECVHKWTKNWAKKYNVLDSDCYIYEKSEDNLSFTKIDTILKKEKDVMKKLEIIKELLAENDNKNRFYIGKQKKHKIKKFVKKILKRK